MHAAAEPKYEANSHHDSTCGFQSDHPGRVFRQDALPELLHAQSSGPT